MNKSVIRKSSSIKAKMLDGKIEVQMEKENIGELYTSMVGVENKAVFDMVLTQTIQSQPKRFNKDDTGTFIMALLLDIKPEDGIEAMLAAQMIATHSLSMEMSKRALLAEQTLEGVNENINRMTKLQRTFVSQMEALQKKRNRGQVIQVQHVNVEAGGQAVVGNVTTGGGK